MKLRSIINILFFCFIYVTISETVFKYFSINIFSGSRHFMILIAFTLPIIYTNTKIKIDKVYFYIILIFLFFILGNFLSKYFDLLRFVYGFFLSFLFIEHAHKQRIERFIIFIYQTERYKDLFIFLSDLNA